MALPSVQDVRHPPRSASRSSAGRLAVIGLPAAFVLVWSSGYLAGSLAVHSWSPLTLLAWRFLVAFVLLGVIAVVTGAPWPTSPRVYLHLLVTGALLHTTQLGGIFLGFQYGVPAGLSSLILSASPLVVAAVAVPLFAERLSWLQWVGLGLGLLGVGISLHGKLVTGGQFVGYACTGLALIGFAAGTLYQKRFVSVVNLWSGMTIQLFGAVLTCFPLAAAYGGLKPPLTLPALGSLAWLAIVNSIGSFALLFVLLRRRSGASATSLLYLVPTVTTILGIPLLGQRVAVLAVAGMIVSGLGVGLAIATKRRPRAR